MTTKKEESLLQFEDTTTVTIPSGQFVVRDHFKKDISGETEVKISYLGDNFKAWFLNKIENHVGGQSTLRFHTLLQDSKDGPIMTELGELAKTTLGEVFVLLKKQSKGEKGALLTNGYANIFYVRDSAQALRAVRVNWYGGGWDVNAYSVGYPYDWDAGYRVFSRDS